MKTHLYIIALMASLLMACSEKNASVERISNQNYEVVSDWLDSSVEKCMEVAASSYKENIQWIKTY